MSDFKIIIITIGLIVSFIGCIAYFEEKPYYRVTLNKNGDHYVHCLVFKTGSVICSHKNSIVYEGNYK